MPLCKARQQLSNASRMKQTGPSVRMPVCTIIYAVISAYFIQQYHLFAVSLGDGEFVFSLPPCSSFLGAGSIGEEFQNYVIFIVGNALTQSIGKGIGGQVGRCGGDAGQSGNNLVIYNVAVAAFFYHKVAEEVCGGYGAKASDKKTEKLEACQSCHFRCIIKVCDERGANEKYTIERCADADVEPEYGVIIFVLYFFFTLCALPVVGTKSWLLTASTFPE